MMKNLLLTLFAACIFTTDAYFMTCNEGGRWCVYQLTFGGQYLPDQCFSKRRDAEAYVAGYGY